MTDWARVTRVSFKLRQHYRYSYTSPVWDLHHRLIVVPRDRYGDQRLLNFSLDVRGTEGDHVVTWERDDLGNRVARVVAYRVPVAIDFETTVRVERVARDGLPPLEGPVERYLEETPLTAADENVEAAARRIADITRDRADRAELAHEWAGTALRYEYGVTGYNTPAAMALHLRRGVCQDYAHILIAVLRMLGVPARYVSGHVLGEGAPHAWVEALVPASDRPEGIEVIAYDPTYRRRAGLDHITVAIGRDYADVSPTSGAFSGPARGKLAATKTAEVVDLVESAEAVA
jgi:transglutaminase-like putative cysteine protease